jgi:hypothetical protein
MRNKFRRLSPWFKYIIATSIGTLFIISSILISNQHKQINDLHYQLQVKKQTEQRASDYSETELDIETIEDKFNELQEYPILKGASIYMNHKYYYSSIGKFGLNSKIELCGRGQVAYDAMVSFKSAVIKSSNNGQHIHVQIKHPYIDSNSIRKVPGSLIMTKEEYSFWSSKDNASEAQLLFEDEFIFKGRGYIAEYYNTESKQQELNKIAKKEVKALIETLNLRCTSVSVDIIE